MTPNTYWRVTGYSLLSTTGDLLPPPGVSVINSQSSTRGQSLLVRVELPIDETQWRVERPTLEEIVLAYLREGSPGAKDRHSHDDEGLGE